MRRLILIALLAGCSQSVAVPPKQPAAKNVAESSTSRPKSPFVCSADQFEEQASILGMPFKGNGKDDSNLKFRGSQKRRAGKEGMEYLWLSRLNGKIRGVVHWRMCEADETLEMSNAAVESFAKLSETLMPKKDSDLAKGWFILARMYAEKYEIERARFIAGGLPEEKIGQTDLAFSSGGIRVSHRRVVIGPGAISHVTNFDIDPGNTEWPEGPFTTEN